MSVEPESSVSRRVVLFAGAASTLAVLLGTSQPASADHTQVAAKLSFDRYYPRIEAGIEEVRAIRDAIANGDLDSAKKLAAERTFSIKLRRALSIYATSFSDSSVNKRSRDLLACVDGFYSNINAAAEAESKEQAIEKYNTAASALQSYVRIARLNKLGDAALSI